MYFDVDHQIEVAQSRVDEVFAGLTREIRLRRGRVIAVSNDILVFSAPFWRANGLLYFFVRQLPIGVSHGILQIIMTNDTCVVRSRISLFWLRVCIAGIIVLSIAPMFAPGAGGTPVVWALLLTSITGSAIVYGAAVVETRRYFKKLLLGTIAHTATTRDGGEVPEQPFTDD